MAIDGAHNTVQAEPCQEEHLCACCHLLLDSNHSLQMLRFTYLWFIERYVLCCVAMTILGFVTPFVTCPLYLDNFD